MKATPPLLPVDGGTYGSTEPPVLRRNINQKISSRNPTTGSPIRNESPLRNDSRTRQSRLYQSDTIPIKKIDRSNIDIKPTLRELLPYYLPFMSWAPVYTWDKFVGDLIAGISLASFQIPLALSYATSIAHVEPVCGLYSLAITPLVYAVFGSVPQMIVGPESAISLVVGQATEQFTAHNQDVDTITISMMITFISGIVLLLLGTIRVGFLGNILSRALLRGFISSVGFVMIINSLISELRLTKILKEVEGHYHTPIGKILFLFRYASAHYHKPTSLLSAVSFLILITMRIAKKKFMKHQRWLIFVPEILIIVAASIYLSLKYDFKHRYNISTIGDFKTDGFGIVGNPLASENQWLFSPLLNAGLAVAMLGFFESTTATKSLGSDYNLAYSSNRELIALGTMNVVGSIFGALPSFGGYGRSKVNVFSGGKTVISGAIVGMITLLTTQLLLPVIHYTPTCVLAVITTIIGISLLEEIPADFKFHIRCHGYSELTVFTLTFVATLCHSVELGVTVGCIYSLIMIVKHSALSRIQILAKMENSDEFVNVDDYFKNGHHNGNLAGLEEFEHCFIVRIPEPLTFTNGEDLRSRLNRLERFGSINVHPGKPNILSAEEMKYLIFDLKGMTSMDSGSTQILREIIESYVNRNVRVYLTRVPMDKQIRERLRASSILGLVENVPVDDARTARNQMEDSKEAMPYFSSIEEALNVIERLNLNRASTREMSTDGSSSVISNTLINSNLV